MKKNRTYGLMEEIGLFKMIKIMRFTIFILFLSLSQTFAVNSYSQQTKLSLDLRNVRVEDVIDKIEKSSEFFFMYNKNMIDVDRKVNIQVEEKSVNEILNKIFANTDISYSIKDRQILLINNSMTNDSGENISQQHKVSGKVIDNSGIGLPGVTIRVKGTTIGTISDSEGKYSIKEIGSKAILEFSFVGMVSQEVVVADRTEINVKLAENIQGIDDVVVIGYGSRAKKDVTTAISTVDKTSIEKVVAMNPQMAMQGTMTGVQVSGNSGNLMDKPTIRIRGVNTWGIADPLYVIDGIPIQTYGSGIDATQGPASYLPGPINVMTLIDPNDIESISVLKDASAAAIYGVRAANGVILITTKKGNGDKPRIEFDMRAGIQNMSQHLDVLNTKQYVNHLQELYASDPTYTVDVLNKDIINPNSPLYLGNSPTYDWQDALKNQNAPLQEYSLRLTGGTGKTDYFISLGYTNQEGTFHGNNLERYNGSFKVNSEVTKWFRTGVNYRISAVSGLNQMDAPIFLTYTKLATAPPWQPVTDIKGPHGYAQTVKGYMPDGTFNSDPIYGLGTTWNYAGLIALNDASFSALRNMGSAYVEIEPIQKFKIRAQVSVDANSRLSNMFDNYESSLINNHLGDPRSKGGGNSVGSLAKNGVRDLNLVKELSVNYKNSFSSHNLDVLFNVMSQRVNAESYTLSTDYMSSANPDIRTIVYSPYAKSESYLSRSALAGMMGRLDYNYNSKYYFDVTVRRDGSSRFAPNKRWGIFPALSAAWRVSGEDFMKQFNWIEDMKLRVGWGQLGNQEVRNMAYLSGISPYHQTTSFGTTSDGRGNIVVGSTIFGIPSPNIQWERTTTTNVGVDATLFNKLNLSLEYYNKLTSGILQEMTVPTSTGIIDKPVENIATVRNSGVEISLNYSNTIGKLTYNIGGNLTTVKNVVEKTYNNIPLWNIEEGYSMFYIKGYKVDGIFQSKEEINEWSSKYRDESYQANKVAPGDVYFKDVRSAPKNPGEFYSNTKDGVINNYDMTYLGKTIPGFYYGFNLGAEWNGIDLSAQFSGVGDVVKLNQVRAQLEYSPSTGSNLSTRILDAWTPNNKSTNVPRVIIGDPAGNFRTSDMFVENASYLRLANLQLGYTLKGIGALSHNAINKLRVYGGVSNLFTITKYSGLDPENDNYPSPRIFTTGINVSF